MGFVKLDKPVSNHTGSPYVTIGTQSQGKATYIALNKSARAALGDPVAVFLEHDASEDLLRLVASSPDDPASYRILKGTGRISVTHAARELGLSVKKVHAMPIVDRTRLSLTVSLKGIPRS